MTLPFWCLFIATLMVYLSKFPANLATLKNEPYDNHHPRLQHLRLEGIGHRAWAAHQNMIEAYPLYAAGVIVSHLAGGNAEIAAILAISFLVSRLFFQGFYLANWGTARSVSWAVGYLSTLLLFLTPLL